MIAVLAGNYLQFREWCAKNRMQAGREARNIERHVDVMGMAFDECTKVGSWWASSDEAQSAFRYACSMRERYRQ